jgi:flagellar biosynthesis protein FliP
MEVDLVVSFWQVLTGIIVVTTAFAGNTYMTKQNQKELQSLKSNEIKGLHDKCNEMMREELARKTFVTLELYTNEVDHLNKTLDEIKKQSNEILRYVRK